MSSIWNAISRYIPFTGGRRLMGKDLAGNKYYEYPNPVGGRARRVIKYRFMTHMADYTSGKHRLPIQWTAWLAYTRANPPSLAELQQDAARQNNLLGRIADIEARERDERIRQGYITDREEAAAGERVHSGLAYARPGRIRSAPSFALAGQGGGSERGQGGESEKVERVDGPSSFVPPVAPSQVFELGPSTASSSTQPAGQVGPGRSSAEESTHRYPVPTPTSPDVPPPPETVDPAEHATKDDLRRLAEEDTKRRIAEQGGEVEVRDTRETGVEGVGAGLGGLRPRRRGGA